MTNYIAKMRIGKHGSLIPCQKGVLLSNNSLKNLKIYLQETYSTETMDLNYILTDRLNQDVIENVFGYLRAMGGQDVRPSALQFKYRLKWYILGKHSRDIFCKNGNTRTDDDVTLVDASDLDGQVLDQDDFPVVEAAAIDSSELAAFFGNERDDEFELSLRDFTVSTDSDDCEKTFEDDDSMDVTDKNQVTNSSKCLGWIVQD